MKLTSLLASGALIASIFTGGGAVAQDLQLATSMPSFGFPFFVHMQKELEAEADSIGGISLLVSDGQNQTPIQTGAVEAAIIKGVDGIIISPIDAVAMAPVLKQAVDAGVHVIRTTLRSDQLEKLGIAVALGAIFLCFCNDSFRVTKALD